jgi:hypothetical protein
MMAVLGVSFSSFVGCAGRTPTAAPCDQVCMDGVALRGLRLAMKSGFNRTLQGNDAGAQDEMTPCLEGGKARVHGSVETNPAIGAMTLDLTYDLDSCSYFVPPDATPARNFHLTFTGTITEKGTLSAQPTSTTSLLFNSSAMTFKGTVSDPPLDYEQSSCALDFGQDGNTVAGTVCGRSAGFSF